MNRVIRHILLLTIIGLLSACGDNDSGESNFDMRGLWRVSIVPGKLIHINIDSQDSGNFSGSGGAYSVEGSVHGNVIDNMSIFIPGSIRCFFHIQQTEEFRFTSAVIENVSPADGQFGEIDTTGSWFTNCSVMEIQITATKLE